MSAIDNVQFTYPAQDARSGQPSVYEPSAAQLAAAQNTAGFSFKDLIDIVNPLQQLPVVGSIYRAVTGDTISAASQIAGGALFGGPMGFVMAAMGAGLSGGQGNLTDTAVAMLDGNSTGLGNGANNAAGRAYANAQYQKTTWLS